jgi:hypothetical protein
MSYSAKNSQAGPADPPSAGEPVAKNRFESDDAPPEQPGVHHAQILEEHHIVGPNGEDEIEATDDRGRRWYDARPEPRGRADFMGFNYSWWLICIVLLVIVFLPW